MRIVGRVVKSNTVEGGGSAVRGGSQMARSATAAALAGEAGSAPLDLITPTSYARAAKVYRYPGGHVEVVCVPTGPTPPGIVRRLRVRREGEEEASGEQGGRSREIAQRAASQFRRAAMACDMRYLLTATYRQLVTDYPTSKHHIQLLLRSLRTDYSGLRYVGAPELQKRGAWHWHVLTDTRLDARVVRKHWLRIVDDGNIDLVHWDDALKGARYAAKYVKKGFGELRVPGVRYLRSRNIEVVCDQIPTDEAFSELSAAGWSGHCVWLETGGWWASSWC